MIQNVWPFPAMLVTGALIVVFASFCTGMSIPRNSTEHTSQSKSNVTNNTPLDNPIFVGEGEGGKPEGKNVTGNVNSSSNNNSTDVRTNKQYFNPYASSLYPSPYALPPSVAAAAGYYNPFPNYYPSQLGGITGPGNRASSCAYAYPNRRYSCLGLGRRK